RIKPCPPGSIQPRSLRRTPLTTSERRPPKTAEVSLRVNKAKRGKSLPLLLKIIRPRSLRQPCNNALLKCIRERERSPGESDTQIHEQGSAGRRHHSLRRRADPGFHVHRRHYFWNNETCLFKRRRRWQHVRGRFPFRNGKRRLSLR